MAKYRFISGIRSLCSIPRHCGRSERANRFERWEKAGAETSERITDKMPSNYHFAGLIHLALPNAKIIHSIRDPVDTCVSCFSKLFAGEQNHAYDLGELGRYYKRYERLMTHWRRILPAGRMLEVQYEDVVADLETQARRIIAYCGLPWDDRCLVVPRDRASGAHRERGPSASADLQERRRPLRESTSDQLEPLLAGSRYRNARRCRHLKAGVHRALLPSPPHQGRL